MFEALDIRLSKVKLCDLWHHLIYFINRDDYFDYMIAEKVFERSKFHF